MTVYFIVSSDFSMSMPANASEERFLQEAIAVARQASCLRSKCGSIIVKDGRIIGTGFNSPAGQRESERRCTADKTAYDSKVTDKTCCMHAEERAIMDALRRHPDQLVGSTLYFIRLDEENNPQYAGAPYCTLCSKLALDAGIALFVLWHETGMTAYPTDEYNRLSYEFHHAQD